MNEQIESNYGVLGRKKKNYQTERQISPCIQRNKRWMGIEKKVKVNRLPQKE